MLTTTVVYSAVQAFVVLLLCELFLPRDVTKGQGSLWMWSALAEHPGVWVNAVTNTVYWTALVYVLRQPLGVVLVVLAFVLASFFIVPFQAVVGIQGDEGADLEVSLRARDPLGRRSLTCFAGKPLGDARLVHLPGRASRWAPRAG